MSRCGIESELRVNDPSCCHFSGGGSKMRNISTCPQRSDRVMCMLGILSAHVILTSLGILSGIECQHVHLSGHAHPESLLLSNDYYQQSYGFPVHPTHNERDHHERDVLRAPYEPLQQYKSERYRLKPSALKAYEDAGNPADYFRDLYKQPLATEGRFRSQYLAVAPRLAPSADLRVAQDAAKHGYADSTPYHTAGNRQFTDVDGQFQYRNFDLTGPNHARYTVRTGSEPTAQDGPIVAFAASPSRDRPAKLFVRDVPIYF
ncbi:putative nuclear hormone receptor HR3-like [Tropilaelaps mercedesae]|uniref:Putative nuclear hormone receptor HR3-like n=1 Tax=Tropilaelaps mercedesae TaxID=418985 RepID=A0A1V9XW50_9ACAR|nr:putative nuclear hormone receptor HR3-like [Tropilaelaps mercedesae]